MKLNRIVIATIITIVLCLTSCTTEDGLDGVKGDPGNIGETGTAGINCWDTNSDGVNDDTEDTNQDGEYNALDCVGNGGQSGADGANCWDTNGNGEKDDNEDINQDGEHDALDCQGANGADGTDGTDGTNGVGLEDLLKFGSISLSLEGTRPDDVAFTDNQIFRYIGVDGTDIDGYNSVVITPSGDDIEYKFELRRFLSTPDVSYQNTNIDIELNITNPGEPSELVTIRYDIDKYAVIGNDNKYFVLDDTFYTEGFYEDPDDLANAIDDGEILITDFELSDFSFDTDTNHLIFNYSYTVDDNNDSENELNVSGSVDVFVLEEI
ncbi:hypothetical protein HME9304_02173 [Flagellimonas maritima]|uniref:Collagen-like protein n=1 Tax=Flagellimonas maritima TaxID=1383885 RepID=A0A2Z4LTU3_9FLAO|nr:hypothetical protein [Allomuricauda aurantiaca]AWX45163.1 hypothetical protein HME9304_02173 [Allomuricauda aurantiaca]